MLPRFGFRLTATARTLESKGSRPCWKKLENERTGWHLASGCHASDSATTTVTHNQVQQANPGTVAPVFPAPRQRLLAVALTLGGSFAASSQGSIFANLVVTANYVLGFEVNNVMAGDEL